MNQAVLQVHQLSFLSLRPFCAIVGMTGYQPVSSSVGVVLGHQAHLSSTNQAPYLNFDFTIAHGQIINLL